MSDFRWNPWSANYSSKEIDQMQFVHRVYLEAMGIETKDLPPTLKMNESFTAPLYTPSKADFDEHTFVRQMQGVVGLLRQPAEEIISCVCGYQKERADRFRLGSAFMNDPRTLLLEEIKEWAMARLAPASCTTEAIEREVEKRKIYITQLQYAGGDLFTPGSGERSLLKTLKDIREILENRVLPMIACERAQASAKDHLTVVEARATDALIHGVQFLFNVFRNTSNAPADCTITNLQSQQHSAMKDAMGSKSGQMLQLLLSTPSFCKLFPESHHHVTGGESKLMTLTSAQQLAVQGDAVFCDASAVAVVPSILSQKELTPKAYLTQSNSGIISFLTAEDYDMFTKMHGLLKLLADLLVSCRQARLLAGTGGDLLVYGPGGAHLRLLLETMQAVQLEIVQCATTLKQRGVSELDKLRSSYSEKNWRVCFSRVLALETYLMNDVSACNDPIRKICEATTPAYVLQAAKEFKAQTSKWVVENANACGHIADTLQLKGLPPMPQLPSSQHRTITAG
ncbi:hypothetical protein ACHHYP_20781 [Achlya hypogyna]|uniref:Uncharacterized protein n=1 Tax=Achlya hypogyna TaxID=1202772 RepID=A0A1V9YA25_ACHHY|nr:hypothetical protein ACHHYP_20781 [Achlya hypogyna]